MTEYVPSQNDLGTLFKDIQHSLETNAALEATISEGTVVSGHPHRIFRSVRLSGEIIRQVTADATVDRIDVETRQSHDDDTDPELLTVEFVRGSVLTALNVWHERANFASQNDTAYSIAKIIPFTEEDEPHEDMDELDEDLLDLENEQSRSVTVDDFVMLGLLAFALKADS